MTCRHCGRVIEQDVEGRWVDPEASGDDSVWRETCDAHDTFVADHEPVTVVQCKKVWAGRYEIHGRTLLGFVDLVGVVERVGSDWYAKVGDTSAFARTMRGAAQAAYDCALDG